MRIPRRSTVLDAGLDRIRDQFGVPAGFPPEVAAGRRSRRRAPHARDRSTSTAPTGRSSRSTRPSSTDLDQAFAIERAGDDIVLHYAIADVGCFVRPGDAARRRGVATRRHGVPARRAGRGCTRPRCRRARPACCPTGPARPWCSTVRVDPHGDVRARRRRAGGRAQPGQAGLRRRVRRATCRPASPSWPGASSAAEERRGAPRVEFPEQELERVRRPLRSCASPRAWRARSSNAAHVAGHEPGGRRCAARRRHRAVPGDGRARRRRRRAAAPHGAGVRARLAGGAVARRVPALAADRPTRAPRRSCSPCAGPAAAPATSRTRRARRRGTRRWPRRTPTPRPRCGGWPIATWSRRRWRWPTGDPVPDDVAGGVRRAARRRWPAGESLANRVDAAVIDLAEAVLLAGRVGEVFDAVVVDEDRPRRRDPARRPGRARPRRRPPRRPRRRDARVRLTAVDVDRPQRPTVERVVERRRPTRSRRGRGAGPGRRWERT